MGRSRIELPESVELVKTEVSEPHSVVPTWDIEVEGTGNFVSEGFIVHNSKLTMKYPSVYLMGEDQKPLGYPFVASNQMTASTLAFGDFSQIVIGEWGGLEIKTRDSLDQTGGTDILGFYSIDVAVRQVTALTVATVS